MNYAAQLLLLLFSGANICSTDVVTINDIFSEKLIKDADEATHHTDWGLDIVQFLEKYDYPLESHEVTTEDGYILTMHRIPYGKNESTANHEKKKPAVLLMHGLICSSMDWVNAGPGKSIALLLADEGYDVWLGNNRGNTWSRKHVSLDPDTNKKFWEFSFDECGYYDLPAMIDYILNATGHEKISYFGHSQGTTQFFAMASLKPEYNDKITIMLAFAPVAYMQNLTHPLVPILAKHWTTIELVAEVLNLYEILPHSQLITDGGRILCHDGSPYQILCIDVLFYLTGADYPQLNTTFLEVILSNAPAGASLQMFDHFIQEYVSGFFRRYDYGPVKNLAVYHQIVPPNYNISSITAPVGLFYAKNDIFTAVVNVEQLAAELPNLVYSHLIEYELFTHIDFLWAKDVFTLLNSDAIQILNQHNQL